MSTSTSETGHNINVANFNTLITYCTGYGTRYNPVLEAIKLPQLQAKYGLAKQKLNGTGAKNDLLNTAINNRMAAFDGLEVLCTNATNAFSASGASPADIKDLQAINKKIQSPPRKKPGKNKDGEETEGISTSQQSYDSKLNFFENLIQFLEAKEIYNPNEAGLKTQALRDKLSVMEVANKSVDTANFNYEQERNARNNELYNPLTGLVQNSKEVKKYVRSIFSSNSPEFRQVNHIEFKVIKN